MSAPTLLDSPCQLWEGGRTAGGYGTYYEAGRRLYAHRAVAAASLGRALSAAEVVMHLCDNPPCVNPSHLRVGTQLDNVRDAKTKGRHVNVIADANRAKTHCKRGHEFTPENTRRTVDGRRNCRTCLRAHNERYADRRYSTRRGALA